MKFAPNSVDDVIRWCNQTAQLYFYIRDHKCLHFLTKNILTRNQPHNAFTVPWQYWLGRIKPKSAFRVAKNTSNKLQNLKNIYLTEFSILTD